MAQEAIYFKAKRGEEGKDDGFTGKRKGDRGYKGKKTPMFWEDLVSGRLTTKE